MKELYKSKSGENYFQWVREDLINFFSAYYKQHETDTENVLEIGCAQGKFGNYFKKKYNTLNYIGIDIFQEAVDLANDEIDTALCDNIENPKQETKELLEKYGFDLIILADVLEHLQNPWDTLKNMQKLLKPNGRIMISIPNGGNIEVIKKLAFDKFEYEERGILDKTHLRFFTRYTILNLIDYSNLTIEFEGSNNDWKIPKIRLFNLVTFGIFKKWFIRQYFFVLKKK